MEAFGWLSRRFIFPRYLVQTPAPRVISGLERWWLEQGDGAKTEVWFLPARGVTAEHRAPAVLFAHGNAELIDFWPDMLERYRELGVSVVLPEYRGYGRSGGSPSEKAIVADLCALSERMARDPRIDMERLIYHGRSLGGGVASALSRVRPPKALVLESTFSSLSALTRDMGVPSFLIADPFDSVGALRAFHGPLLIMHGSRDTLIPRRHADVLAAANPRAKLVIYDADHNDLPPPGSDYWQQIEALVAQVR
jgi:hypothetical protein